MMKQIMVIALLIFSVSAFADGEFDSRPVPQMLDTGCSDPMRVYFYKYPDKQQEPRLEDDGYKSVPEPAAYMLGLLVIMCLICSYMFALLMVKRKNLTCRMKKLLCTVRSTLLRKRIC